MARLPAVLELLAPLDGRPYATLDVVARHLRYAGMFSTFRPGRGSADVTNEDAANLLLACMGGDVLVASPRTVEVLRSLKRRPAPRIPNFPRTVGLLIQLPNLGEFTDSLLDYGDAVRRECEDYRVEFSVSRPVPRAELAMIDVIGRRTVVAEWVVDVNLLMAGFYRQEQAQRADKRITATVSGETIYALADLLAREPEGAVS